MKILEITALPNGAHRNQTGSFTTVPDGWAVIPDGMDTQNFPFGEITLEENTSVPTVATWSPLPVPEPEPEPDPEPTADEILNALLGVTE